MAGFLTRGSKIDKALTLIENIGLGVGMVATVIIMVFVSIDATFRHLFSRPLSGVYEITQDYLLVGLVFLSLSYTYRRGWFIRVTVIADALPAKFVDVTQRVCRILALAVCVLIVVSSFEVALKAYQVGEFSSNLLMYPVWPAYMLVPIGVSILCVRLLLYAISPPKDH